MGNDIQIVVNSRVYMVKSGTSLLEVSKLVARDYNYPIILAKINNEYKELTESITEKCQIEFFDISNRLANKIYTNSLILLLSCCYKGLTGRELKVNHSLDRGLYITTEEEITEETVLRIKTKMQELVERDLPITHLNVTRMNAMDYYEARGEKEKVGNMKYNTNTSISLYQLEDYYDYFYSYMAPSTGCLSLFNLTYLNPHGFILSYKTLYDKEGIKSYEHRKNLYELFQTSRAWARSIGLEYVVDLNEEVAKSKIGEIIMMDETKKNAELLYTASEISANSEIKIVLMAGPSSSGKTTTCNKLALCLKSYGKNAITISMDDYFVERNQTPLKADGSRDYENINAIDLGLFNDTISGLIEGKEVLVPHYDFIEGRKEFTSRMKLPKGGILLIEGIHALNPKILENIPSHVKCKIYLAALTELNVDKHNRISTSDNRLLRRIVRDNRTRGYSVEDTLKSWANVRSGEEENIFPYQDTADYTLNTAMIYEIGVLKVYAEPLLYAVDVDSLYYEDAKRLINFLRVFLPIPSESIPKDSILREFIGGSSFE